MQRLTKSDCGLLMTQEEFRQMQIGMLDELAHFCDENHLRYYLSGGTLLGAIRHKGFIPWDDDIDVNMPRPDCEKLMQLTKGFLGSYEIASPFGDLNAPYCDFYRIYNLNAVIENTHGVSSINHPYYQPVFIDVFPIDGLPDTEKKTKNLYCKIRFLRKILVASHLQHIEGRNLFSKVFYFLARFPSRMIGSKRLSIWLDRIERKYPFEEQQYIGVTTSGVHFLEEKMPKKDYLPVIEVEFVGKKYHAPQNYDHYLTQLYGNYMELPPEDKRNSQHGFTMYWRKK